MKRSWQIIVLPLIISLACDIPFLTNLNPNIAPTVDLPATMMALGIQQTQTAMAGGGSQMTFAPSDTAESIATSTATFTLSPTLTPSITPSVTSTPLPCNLVGNIIDVNYPDGSKVTQDAIFVKTWRITNYGSCTWTSGYSLVFVGGDPMDTPAAVTLTSGTVPPGGSVEVSVQLKAPHAKGTYQGNYRLREPGGTLFGYGPAADQAFWVLIKVPAPTAVPLPDLKITQIEPCAAPKQGVPCTMKVSVYNSGDSSLSSPFKVKLYIGSAPDAKCSWDIPSISMGGGYVKSCSYTFPSWYGSITLRAIVDEANNINETNEANNQNSISISVAH